jgi:hypothetical protein
MAISVRLDEKLMRKLASIAKAKGLSTSELIRQCLTEYLAGADKPTAWDLGKDLFGCFHSRKGDLSVRAKDIAMECIHARRIKTNRR